METMSDQEEGRKWAVCLFCHKEGDIDDKLSRMKNLQDDDNEDVINDLIGYLILLKIAIEQGQE